MTRFGNATRPSGARPPVLLGLALLVAGACGGKEFSDPPCPEESTNDAYEIALKLPDDVHLGEVIPFTFTVKREGAAVSGLTPEAAWKHDSSGAEGAIKLGGAAPGEYSGTKAFFTSGAYTIRFHFQEGGSSVARTFPMTVAASH